MTWVNLRLPLLSAGLILVFISGNVYAESASKGILLGILAAVILVTAEIPGGKRK